MHLAFHYILECITCLTRITLCAISFKQSKAKLLTHFTQLPSCLGVTRVCSELRVRTHAAAEGKAEGGMGSSGGPCVCLLSVLLLMVTLCFLGSRNMNVKKETEGRISREVGEISGWL